MPSVDISFATARALILQAQGLFKATKQPAAKEDVATAIARLGALQIDTINIVARAPYFSLFSRLGNYPKSWLDESLAEGTLFEYWAHAASFLPIETYPYHRRLMLEKMRLPSYHKWYQRNQAESDALLEYVRAHGPVRSADFERKDGRKGSWWDWKFEKDALEFWFCAGELMIARREKFQRVYDLRERVHPAWKSYSIPSLDETVRYFVKETVRALGVARPDWVADYFRLHQKLTKTAIQELLGNGTLSEVSVEGWPEPALILADSLPLLDLPKAELNPSLTTLLSPFDSLIWDRKRTKQLFNFDFTIECYLPPAKRNYGYFLLPILYCGSLVGRIDAKAHRKEGVFEVIGLFWEPGLKVSQKMLKEVGKAIQRCADWHGTPKVVIQKCVPEILIPLLD